MINFQPYSPRAKKQWFKTSAKLVEGKKIGEIEIFDFIDSYSGMSDKELISQIKTFNADNVDKIIVYINSGGGSVFEGFNIFNALISSKAPVTTIITGLAASISSIIAMAGQEILMYENSTMMIHNAWSVSVGNAKDMMDTAQILQKLDSQIISIYAKRFNVDKIQIEHLMEKETWFTAAEAKEIGAINGIITSEEAKTIMASTFDLSIYNNVPKELLNKNVEDRLLAAKEGQTEEEQKQKMYQRRLELALRDAEVQTST